MRLIFILLLLFTFVLPLSCAKKQDEISKVISEVEKKETELKEVGIPSFLLEEQKTEEQKTTETNTNFLITEKPKEITSTISPPEKTDITVFEETQKEYKPIVENYIPQKIQTKTPEPKKQIKPYKLEKTYRTNSLKDFKIYFSHKNGKNYIDKKNPGKITTVLYVDKNIWYIDYNVYAIPSKFFPKYRPYLNEKYLIGIGRNISVVDSRSQLTVYWSGVNLNKKFLTNGKYHIVVNITLKNPKKKPLSKVEKVLGKNSPLEVILAN